MFNHIQAITNLIGDNALLIEYGSGSSSKTRLLLEQLPQLAGYIPIDIAQEHLLHSADQLARAYPHLEILPVCADYEADFELPTPQQPVAQKVIYYPGSTIGNFHPTEAVNFLRQMRRVCGSDASLLIGVDLKKDVQILHEAYNDRAGVTAEFNLNILRHLNRKLGSNFNLNQFQREAFYNEINGRIEMHLVSTQQQSVCLNGRFIHFSPGECIWTESSYKYTPDEFAALAAQAGFQLAQTWLDPQQLFSVHYFMPIEG